MQASFADKRRRVLRFSASYGDGSDDDVALVDSGGMGTSTALEKEYLRLTSMPRQSDVRPPEVLAAALRMVKAKWLAQADYAYACGQLKSIRQVRRRQLRRAVRRARACVRPVL